MRIGSIVTVKRSLRALILKYNQSITFGTTVFRRLAPSSLWKHQPLCRAFRSVEIYGMQTIYWVITWACHRKCRHCYDDRFRPYAGSALTRVVAEGQNAY